LLAVLPDRKSYYLYAYGDSKGDKEMICFADEGLLVK
jgi:phosphoserine phosphatase